MSFAFIAPIWKLFHRFRGLVGMDKAVCYSVISRGFSTSGSLITIPLILTRLTAVEQGFYYTFGSILAMQVFLEMGFGSVAIQMVAHEAAHLKIGLASGASGSDLYLDRFSATIRFIRSWYQVLALLVGVFLFPVGFWFFSASASGSSATWLGPWAIMVVVAAGGVVVNSLSSIIEGMGFVAESIRVRLWGGGTQILLTIAGLLAGFRLYAMPLAGAVALVINFGLAWHLLRHVIRETSTRGMDTRIDWVNDVLPFQWRVALSWISGWFIFSAMLPVVFRQLGPAEAGRFGLAMSITNFIAAFSTNWIATKSAIWGQMVSRKEWPAMDALFWKVMPQAVGIATFASAGALLLTPNLGEWIPRFAGRVPEARVLLLLCSVAVVNQVIFAQAFYLRAHKREPFLVNSVFGGVVMAIFLFGLAHTSSFSIAATYAIITWLGLIWGSFVFVYCRAHWHAPELIAKAAS